MVATSLMLNHLKNQFKVMIQMFDNALQEETVVYSGVWDENIED